MSQKCQSSKGRGRCYDLRKKKKTFYFTVAGRSIHSQDFLCFLFYKTKVDIMSSRKELSPKQCKIFENNILSTCLHK